MPRLLAVACVLLPTVACTSRPCSPPPDAAPSPDVAGVIAAVFTHVFSTYDGSHLAVSGELTPDEGVFMVPYGIEDYDPEAELLADVQQHLPALRLETAEDFVRRQHGNEPLPAGMKWPAGVDLGGDDAFESWDAWYRKHPKSLGILTFSPVGFSRDGQQALAFYSLSEEGLSGRGNLVLLERAGGRWRVVAEENVWIA